MRSGHVPVSTGGIGVRSVEMDAFRVSDLRWPGLSGLPRHTHDRPILAVILEGDFSIHFPTRTLECTAATLFTEPAAERHGNRFGREGARSLALELDLDRLDLPQRVRTFLDRVNHFADIEIHALAARVAREIAQPDDLSPLVIEGLAYEILGTAVRNGERERGLPGWLRLARDFLHLRFSTGLRLGELAREVGVQPAHLARVFRAKYGVSVGAYVRRLRVEDAKRQLADSELPIAQVAFALGFADQSHFTRAFARVTGVTPGRYRASLRSRRFVPRASNGHASCVALDAAQHGATGCGPGCLRARSETASEAAGAVRRTPGPDPPGR
jgi:AraC family transcriptional regulator